MNFEFATATRIIFGVGALEGIGPLAAAMGHRALVVTGSSPARAMHLLDLLESHGVDFATFTVAGEPKVMTAREGAQKARETGCDLIIGFGGGSVIDAGKAIAALMTNPGDPFTYLEVVGKGQSLTQPSAPFIAIPTTAGTGSEVTRNAVLLSAEHKLKVSLRSPTMLPRIAIVDPSLTHKLPPAITASTGLDAVTQLIEPFVSNRANPITDAFCREGLGRAARSLYQAYNVGDDPGAREDMALASLLGGMALANARLGAVHGFAAPIGGMFNAPHGAICAALLPHVMAMNITALRARDHRSEALERYTEVARIVTGRQHATIGDGIAWVRDLVTGLNIPPLSAYGISRADFATLIPLAENASSMQGNPVKLTASEMQEILSRAL